MPSGIIADLFVIGVSGSSGTTAVRSGSFHRSSVQGTFDELKEGQRVNFDEEPRPRGRGFGTSAPKAERRIEFGRRNPTTIGFRPVTKIILFDIDGTLVLTGGGGRACDDPCVRRTCLPSLTRSGAS